jgi:hypothetical protein
MRMPLNEDQPVFHVHQSPAPAPRLLKTLARALLEGYLKKVEAKKRQIVSLIPVLQKKAS